MTLRSLFEDFLTDADTRLGWSRATIRAYRSHIGSMLTDMEARLGRPPEPSDYTLEALQVYDTARKRSAVTSRSRASQMCALRSFARWMLETGALTEAQVSPILLRMRVRITGQPKQPRATEAQVAELFAACDRIAVRSSWRAFRPHLSAAVLGVMAYCGLRRAEVIGLNLADVIFDAEAPHLIVRHGKGDKKRTVPLHPEAVRLVRAWLEYRPQEADALFCLPMVRTKNGPCVVPLTAHRLVGILAELCKLAGAPWIQPHAFRRFAATKLLEVPGSSFAYVRDFLGHSDIAVTLRYVGTEAGKLTGLINQMQLFAPTVLPAAPPRPVLASTEPASTQDRIVNRVATGPRSKRSTWRRVA